MKKWLLTCLFVLLATLLCTACAEDEREHKWYWKKADFTNHVKFCEICGVPDRTSTAKQDESFVWPDEPPKDSDGNPEQVLTGPIKCSVCGWGVSQSFSAETSDIHVSTCTAAATTIPTERSRSSVTGSASGFPRRTTRSVRSASETAAATPRSSNAPGLTTL